MISARESIFFFLVSLSHSITITVSQLFIEKTNIISVDCVTNQEFL